MELLDHAGHDGVDAGTVHVRQLGQIAHAHEDLRLGMAPPRLRVALHRGREAEAERVEDGIEHVRDAGRRDLGRVLLQRLETLAEIRDHDHLAAQVRDEVDVLPVDAQQEVDPGRVRRADGAWLEGVDADREVALLECSDRGLDAVMRLHRRTAEVDDVGPAAR